MKRRRKQQKRVVTDGSSSSDSDAESDDDNHEGIIANSSALPTNLQDCSKRTIHVPFPAGRPMMVAGPTGCGKTCWVYKLLQSRYNFTLPVHHILYCYGVYQPLYSDMKRTIPGLEFHKGLPNLKTIKEFAAAGGAQAFNIVVLDDLMERVVDNMETQQLFTKFCHHYNFSTIYLTQNVFAAGRCARNISLNTLVLVLFQNYRDRSQIWTVGRQLCPTSPSLFVQVFEKATQREFGYLVVDCTPQCQDEHRWRTNIFKDEDSQGTCFVHPQRALVPASMPLVSTRSKHSKKLLSPLGVDKQPRTVAEQASPLLQPVTKRRRRDNV
jgi:GTPase SAR1 family protein